ncbi:MAG: hypothetical protein WCA46_11310 [Actinocatenispora sp.]
MRESAQGGTVLREETVRGPATVLVEANDRLQEIRSLLAVAVKPGSEPGDQQTHQA